MLRQSSAARAAARWRRGLALVVSSVVKWSAMWVGGATARELHRAFVVLNADRPNADLSAARAEGGACCIGSISYNAWFGYFAARGVAVQKTLFARAGARADIARSDDAGGVDLDPRRPGVHR